MSGAAFFSVSVESQGLASVVSLAKALPKWKCEFLNQACSDQASQYIHCTFSNGLPFQKRASFRPSGAGDGKSYFRMPFPYLMIPHQDLEFIWIYI